MMKQQPDKFFKEHLENFQLPVPSGAWNRVNANLHKSSNKPLWLKIAAAIALLITIAFLSFLVVAPTSDKIQPLSLQPEVNTPVELKEKNDVATAVHLPAEQKKQKSKANTHAKSGRKWLQKKRLPIKSDESRNTKSTSLPEEERENFSITIDSYTLPDNYDEAPVEENPISTANHGVTLTYAAEEVNTKYITKKPSEEATLADKKTSTLKKLLEKAYDLKTNQNPLGELRQKKNEILALNFNK
jgi:hypothetical protein